MNSLYIAGSEPPFDYSISLDFDREQYNAMKADMITRWVEFWCQENCGGKWRVEEYPSHLSVQFNLITDMVLFRLSPEYSLS